MAEQDNTGGSGLGIFINNICGPIGVLLPHHYIDRKDTKGQFASNTFKAKIAYPKEVDGQPNKMEAFQKGFADAVSQAMAVHSKSWPADMDKRAIVRPWSDGDKKTEKDGYKGHWIINSKAMGNCSALTTLSPNKRVPADPSVFYAGCLVRGIYCAIPYGPTEDEVRVKNPDGSYDTIIEKKWGVTFKLKGIQFVRDGDPIASEGGQGIDLDAIPDLPDDAVDTGGSDDSDVGL